MRAYLTGVLLIVLIMVFPSQVSATSRTVWQISYRSVYLSIDINDGDASPGQFDTTSIPFRLFDPAWGTLNYVGMQIIGYPIEVPWTTSGDPSYFQAAESLDATDWADEDFHGATGYIDGGLGAGAIEASSFNEIRWNLNKSPFYGIGFGDVDWFALLTTYVYHSHSNGNAAGPLTGLVKVTYDFDDSTATKFPFGDTDFDEDIDFDDYNTVVGNLGETIDPDFKSVAITWEEGDFDGDEEVTMDDYGILQAQVLVGDMNGDGNIDSFDVSPFELALSDPSSYASAYPDLVGPLLGDADHNAVFDVYDIDDFEALLGGASVPIPEPLGSTVLVFGICAMVIARPSSAACLARLSAGSNMAISSAMMAMTTSSSIRVKARTLRIA